MEKKDNQFSGDEKRKCPRVESAVVEFKFRENDEFKKPAFIKNLSTGGVCVYTYEDLSMNQPLFLKIHLFGGREAVETKGEVVWNQKSSYKGYFEFGIKFDEMEKGNVALIAEHIARILTNNPKKD